MTTTRQLIVFDWPVIWANLLFLFTITMTPLMSTIAGSFGNLGDAWAIYCAFMVAIGAAQTLLFMVVSRGGGRLVGGLTGREYLHRLLRAMSPGLGFGAGLALNLAGYEYAGALCWVLIPVIMIAARLLFGPRRAKRAAAPPT